MGGDGFGIGDPERPARRDPSRSRRLYAAAQLRMAKDADLDSAVTPVSVGMTLFPGSAGDRCPVILSEAKDHVV
jgi:hypothetical protein